VSPDRQRFLLQTFPDNRAIPIRVVVNWPAFAAELAGPAFRRYNRRRRLLERERRLPGLILGPRM
jgi:hypothetical protein